jgi:DNA adenine methylase
MQYMGSKNRIAKEILPIILKNRKEGQWYVEPFVGGCNMIDKVTGNRIGNDVHYFLIEMWKALQDGWKPPENVSKDEYHKIKADPHLFNPALVGFVGFLCSFGGKWWGGYASNTKGDNYAERGARVLLKQIKSLDGVRFTNSDYWLVPILPNSIVYCDPPYRGTTGYANKFDHELFWSYVRNLTNLGHIVFVSEYSAPDDFECILEIQHKTILDKNSQSVRVEKLFRQI